MTSIYEDNRLFCISIAMKITGNMSMAEDAVHNAFIEIIKEKKNILRLTVCLLRNKELLRIMNRQIAV